MRRIGLQNNGFNVLNDKSTYENPTILRFKNTDAFLAAYRDSHYLSRPERYKELYARFGKPDGTDCSG